VSDRPEDRPVPPLAHASARHARTHTDGTDDGTSTERSASTQADRTRRPGQKEASTPGTPPPTENEATTHRRRAKPRTGTLGGSNRMLSAREVATILGIPERTIREKWREWRLPAYRIGKHLRWKERDVYAWIDQHAA